MGFFADRDELCSPLAQGRVRGASQAAKRAFRRDMRVSGVGDIRISGPACWSGDSRIGSVPYTTMRVSEVPARYTEQDQRES